MIDGKEWASEKKKKGMGFWKLAEGTTRSAGQGYSMEQVTCDRCVLKDDKELPDSKWGQWTGKAFRVQPRQAVEA